MWGLVQGTKSGVASAPVARHSTCAFGSAEKAIVAAREFEAAGRPVSIDGAAGGFVSSR